MGEREQFGRPLQSGRLSHHLSHKATIAWLFCSPIRRKYKAFDALSQMDMQAHGGGPQSATAVIYSPHALGLSPFIILNTGQSISQLAQGTTEAAVRPHTNSNCLLRNFLHRLIQKRESLYLYRTAISRRE